MAFQAQGVGRGAWMAQIDPGMELAPEGVGSSARSGGHCSYRSGYGVGVIIIDLVHRRTGTWTWTGAFYRQEQGVIRAGEALSCMI
jgi:hypothetical protein